MKYNIDKISLVNHMLVKIEGWVVSRKCGGEKIEVTTGECCQLVRVERDDVRAALQLREHSCKYGFEIIAEYPGNHLYYKVKIDDGRAVKYVKVKLADASKQDSSVWGKMRISPRRRLPELESFQGDAVSYNIEQFSWYPDLEKFIIKGWEFSKKTGASNVYVGQENELIKCSRQDVCGYYKKSGVQVNETCGFIVYTGKQANGISIMFGSGTDTVTVHFNMPYLKRAANYSAALLTRKLNAAKLKSERKKCLYKYGKNGMLYKEKECKIRLEEDALNRSPYHYEKIEIPQAWIEMQKKKPSIDIIIALKYTDCVAGYLRQLVGCLARQKYKKFRVIFIGSKKDIANLEVEEAVAYTAVESCCKDKMGMYAEALAAVHADYFLFLNQEDYVEEDFLASYAEQLNINYDKTLLYSDYDIDFKGELIFPVKRKGNYKNENTPFKLVAALFSKNKYQNAGSIEQLCSMYSEGESVNINRIYYHYRVVEDVFAHGLHNKSIAFYLPQFHETQENNKWWGKGFTEWTNVKRGVPMFEGHNQPRIPADFGYYNLVKDKSVQYKQVELAKKYGVYGFCFYYYWFQGKRLLRKPLDQYAANKELNLPFCICWANETWSRRWDGEDKEILMKQVHNAKTDKEFIKSVIPLFRDERYIKCDGKPLLLIYRIGLFPRPARTISEWRTLCKEEGIGDIHIALVQSMGMVDHRIYGADSSVEFPPHKIMAGEINDRVLQKGKQHKGKIYSYEEVVKNQMIVQKRDYTLYPGSMLEWDNTARKMNAANIFHEYRPELFEKWLMKNQMYTRIYNPDPIMFINAWNEWAEGSYLEPDKKYGTQALEAVKEAAACK